MTPVAAAPTAAATACLGLGFDPTAEVEEEEEIEFEEAGEAAFGPRDGDGAARA